MVRYIAEEASQAHLAKKGEFEEKKLALAGRKCRQGTESAGTRSSGPSRNEEQLRKGRIWVPNHFNKPDDQIANLSPSLVQNHRLISSSCTRLPFHQYFIVMAMITKPFL